MTKLVKVSLRNKKGNFSFGYRTEDYTYYFIIAASYMPSNNGGAFARNHTSSGVYVSMFIDDEKKSNLPRKYPWETPFRETIIEVCAGRAFKAAEADKIAREYIRENKLRIKLLELAKNHAPK